MAALNGSKRVDTGEDLRVSRSLAVGTDRRCILTVFFSLPVPCPIPCLVSVPQEDADKPHRVPEREECASVYGRALGVVAERAGERERHTGIVHAAEEGRDQEENGN